MVAVKETDLHGYSAKSAKAEIVLLIKQYESMKHRTRLIFITGKGLHSPGMKPVIKPLFLDLMKQRGIQVHEINEGKFQISV